MLTGKTRTLLIACAALLALSSAAIAAQVQPAGGPAEQPQQQAEQAEQAEQPQQQAEQAEQAEQTEQAEQATEEPEQPQPVDIAELARAARAVSNASQEQVQALRRMESAAPEHSREAIQQLIAMAQQLQTRAEEALELAQAESSFQRANLHWKHARTRIAQMQQLNPEEKPRSVQLLALQYCDAFDDTYANLRQAQDQGQNVGQALQALGAHQQHHSQVLKAVRPKLPEGARAVVTSALDRAQRAPQVALHPPTEKKTKTAAKPKQKGQTPGPPPGAVKVTMPNLPKGVQLPPEAIEAMKGVQKKHGSQQ